MVCQLVPRPASLSGRPLKEGKGFLHSLTETRASVPCSVQDVDTKNNIVTLGPIYNVHLNRQYATKGHVANTQLLKLCQVRST